MKGILLRLVPVCIAAIVGVGLVASHGDGSTTATAVGENLPDLDPELPSDLQITHTQRNGKRVYRLGFESAARNVGAGPLIIAGRRLQAAPEMTADQVIERRGQTAAVVKDVGRLRYVRSSDHQHWHLLAFLRYELRTPGRDGAVVRDRKTGFCLGDRYRATTPPIPAQPPAPRYTSRCGLGDTGLRSLVQGISVGYGDNYHANLEGQLLRLTGLRSGRYVLVHRVNVGRRLRERRYRNNASSLLIRLRWSRGVPRVGVLKSCPATARCVTGKSSARAGSSRRR